MDTAALFQHVLLVEDDSGHAMLITRALREFAAQITHQASLKAALEDIDGLPPDLVLTDLNLPDAAGAAGVRSLLLKRPNVPHIVLTSSTSLRDAVEAMKAGAKDYLVKNFGPEFREALGLSLSRVQSILLVEAERAKFQREIEALRAAIENSGDGLAVARRDGKVDYCNRSFQGMIENWGGDWRNLAKIISQRVVDHKKLTEAISDKIGALTAGAVWKTQIFLVDDKQSAFDLSLSFVGDAGARPADDSETGTEIGSAASTQAGHYIGHCVVWLKDVSEQLRRERFQREMVATTSHDLKGPLGAIVLSSEMLVEMLQGQERPHSLAVRIGSSAKSTLNLIEQFLSARRIKEGNFVLRPQKQPISPIVGEIIESQNTIAQAKGLTVNFLDNTQALEPDGLEWKVDKIAFERILTNLLSNAFKFTPRGGEVKVVLDKYDSALHLAVSDNGCGMEPGDVSRIFERYSRLAQHSGVQGTGLGLYVVRAIVAAHGGKIEVTSKVGQGSSFELIFPQDPPVNARGELICLDFN